MTFAFLLAATLTARADLAILNVQYNLPAHTAAITVSATQPWELWKGVDHLLFNPAGELTVYTSWTQITKVMRPGPSTVVVDPSSHPKQNEHYQVRGVQGARVSEERGS